MSKFSRQLVFTSSTITVDGVSVGATYDIPFGTPNASINELMEFMTITGSATLTSSLTIMSSSTPSCPITIVFYSTAAINLNGNTITIFGTSLTQAQASNPFVITACYNGTSFTSVLSRVEVPASGMANSQLASMATGTFKGNILGSGSTPQDVTYSQTRTALNVDYDLINVVVDFNSGYLHALDCRQDILIPYQGQVTRVFGYVTQDIQISNDAIIEFGIAGSAGGAYSTFSTLTFSAGQAADTFAQDTSPSTPDNVFNTNEYLAVRGQKVTWGGRVTCTIVTKRT